MVRNKVWKWFFFPGQGKSGNFILRQENLDKVDEKKIQKRVDS